MKRKKFLLATTNLTTTESRQSPIVRLINQFGEILNRLHIRPVNLSRKKLMANACKQTGLSDWGEEDFLTPLTVLLDAYEREADLSLLGRLIVQKNMIRLLTNRLRIQSDLTRHPEILQQPVNKPLFIVGLPRTGTTLLFNLLDQDPRSRTPLWWELYLPSPPPEKETRQTDPRIAFLHKQSRRMARMIPLMRSIHPMTATSLEECYFIFQNMFSSWFFNLMYNVPTYGRWLSQHDMVPAYRYYRSVLQLLQWRTPGEHWTLKSPHHLFHLDALLAVFPDACIIHTHRDLVKAIGSSCSMMAMFRRMSSHNADPTIIGSSILNDLAIGVDRAMDVRKSAPAGRFYDLHYRDLMADPKGQVKKIYDYFGYPFDEGMSAGMDHWLRENRQHKHGVHHYSLEQFGLSAQQIRARFAEYIDQYAIEDEG